ncbi:serine/threonine protein kinase [Aerosakkonema funiforme]|uniref:serine/threonine protein kinase n=1 Tax=Aerosakkonema funiforme TaxID=1246630 RepID=UPI0035BB86F9
MVWAAGQRLQKGKYIIEKVLGEGGFGITYQARHTLLEQIVVIKTPNERLKNDPEYPKYLQRFVEEGRRLEKLSEKQHPNIVRVRDLFEKRGIYCLVMDFVAGESLFDLVRRRGALPENEAVEYVRQIGEALMVIHQARLVHRDAHPGNIMVQSDGKAVLIDFGIAGEILQTVESSKHFGNIAFAPYEQMMGSREPTVDVYCLAASLYYAVTGQCPTSSLDRKLKNVGLIKPKQRADISDDLNRAILKGMELEAKNRPQSMHEWLKLLEVANRTVPVSLPPKKQISIPWGRLIVVALIYGLIGRAIASWALPFAWAMAIALTVAVASTWAWRSASTWAWAEHLSSAWAWLSTLSSVSVLALTRAGTLPSPIGWYLPLAMVLTWALTWYLVSDSDLGWVSALNFVVTGIWAWPLTGGLCVASAVAWASAKAWDELENSFSNFHRFLILVLTSWLGLGLGWLAYQIFLISR